MSGLETAADWIGAAILLLSYIFVLTIAFQKSTGWGLGSLFLWPVGVIFVLLNFRETSFWVGGMALGIAILSVF
ncbi:hypothetical protein [Alcanivorax sp. DP30]|uniref:hypothetical protein n=1 Tax=Alcanivorax sp. DP30 TaxID=2606217 RepID=UPI00137066D5|nr:hypothetical protein [Alcanivorax sp. DP30]MZR61441.1 hypothetical protein [Alcanivorax sp. DP30]